MRCVAGCCARIDAVPQHNVRLFDEMQAHQLLIPCEDKAIWHCQIEASGGWSSELTLLRFSPSLIWENQQQRPEVFQGTVTPIEPEPDKPCVASDPEPEPVPATQPNEEPLSGEAFWLWLTQNVQQRLEINVPNARIHTVAGTAFLVTPGILSSGLAPVAGISRQNAGGKYRKRFRT